MRANQSMSPNNVFVNSREEQYSNLINANDEQLISMMKEEEEYAEQIRQQ